MREGPQYQKREATTSTSTSFSNSRQRSQGRFKDEII
jgi:hypothetical protein